MELTWQPTHPYGQSESLLSKAIQWQLRHCNIGRSDCVKEDEKYNKHYQLTENRAYGEEDKKRTVDATTWTPPSPWDDMQWHIIRYSILDLAFFIWMHLGREEEKRRVKGDFWLHFSHVRCSIFNPPPPPPPAAANGVCHSRGGSFRPDGRWAWSADGTRQSSSSSVIRRWQRYGPLRFFRPPPIWPRRQRWRQGRLQGCYFISTTSLPFCSVMMTEYQCW